MTETDTTQPDWEAGCSCGWHGMSEDADDHPCSLPTYINCPFSVAEHRNGTALDDLHADAAVLADPSNSTIYTQEYPNLGPLAARRLSMISTLENDLERVRQQLVDDARAAGMTWDAIGYELRVSRQAAQKRFGGAK